uniref:Retrovirus-related Pol polyprotein from transposon TNT 1-94 n=1 Tax=Tanacetum cinerariifolium TaxID=118510 RepID=A0A6L2K1I9_TANCI|nr:retrovirus-related Pol polyprotein from transposon TNT 1-94 [Tanacetum cinerariifolium]
MGLDDQFSVIKTQILAMKPAPKLSAVYHLVAKHEQQRTIATSKRQLREVAAFQARNLIEARDCRGGLYWMGGIKEERKVMAVTIDAWHKRLGHASNVKLSRVSFLRDVSSTFNAKEKYRRLSLTRANCFLTIVDDYSRMVWLYLLKHKHEASSCLIDFYNLVKTHFGKRIKRIRCDNGGEFVSNNMNEFYREHGIVLETTWPHTPQQNGVVERKHRHLLEIARALQFEASLPITFWGSVSLRIRTSLTGCPKKVINDKTPYEVLFRQNPEYDDIFDESFYEAWEHFNDLPRACPHHEFSELHQLGTFYNALNVNDQDSLNSAAGGNFLDKMPRECMKIIESKSKVCQSRAKAVVAKVSTSSSTPIISSDVAELKDMVKALLLDKKNQSPAPTPSTTPAPVKAVEPNYVTCGGAYSY